MKITGFDIETYREHFCFVGIMYDSDTKEEIKRVTVTDKDGIVDTARVAIIDSLFDESDYIVSFNGKRFDLPVLAKIYRDVNRTGFIHTKYINADAIAIMSYDSHNNPIVKKHARVQKWHAKHFDLLNNCLLRHSLKQWEMYENLDIKELPYDPQSELTPEMKAEIDEYCAYDVWAMMTIFWRRGYDKTRPGETGLLAQKALMQWWPEDLPFSFDKTSASVGCTIVYETNTPIPPKTNQPLGLFDLNSFDVPLDIKVIIGYLAKAPNLEYETKYKGISYGRGGCHFAKKGLFKNVFTYDFASLYSLIIGNWQLLKTKRANARYLEKRLYRINEVKHKKKDHPELKTLDDGLKLFLNAPTGCLRIRSGLGPMYDPAAGDAMCFIGQLLISELIYYCPDFENVIEVNTDSVFVLGEENKKACDERTKYFKDKYDLLLEKELVPYIHFRDVNCYAMYDKDGKLTGGKGATISDFFKKNSERAVYDTFFNALITNKVDTSSWKDRPWQDFVVKYHKSAASKYAMIDGVPMEHKNYYFMWTTRDCPDAVPISFSRDLIDRKSGAIKARFGVWSQVYEDLGKYAQYIDHEQYVRDVDAELLVWNRPDLTSSTLSKIQRKSIKTLADLIRQDYL